MDTGVTRYAEFSFRSSKYCNMVREMLQSTSRYFHFCEATIRIFLADSGTVALGSTFLWTVLGPSRRVLPFKSTVLGEGTRDPSIHILTRESSWSDDIELHGGKGPRHPDSSCSSFAVQRKVHQFSPLAILSRW